MKKLLFSFAGMLVTIMGMVHGVEVQWPGIMLLVKCSHEPVKELTH